MRCLALGALVLLCGCPSTPTAGPIAPSIDLVIVDARLDFHDTDQPPYFDGRYWVPIQPWYLAQEGYNLHRSLLPQVREALVGMGLTGKVVSADHPPDERLSAEYELRLTLEETRTSRRTSCYAVGPLAIALHLFLPCDFTSAQVRLKTTLISREGNKTPISGEGSGSVGESLWIYETYNAEPALLEALREALHESLESAMER